MGPITQGVISSPLYVSGAGQREPGNLQAVAVEDEVRLSLLSAEAGHRSMLDGAWWPRSHSLAGELPPLIRELHRRGARMTRASYSLLAFEPAARKLEADGRTIRLGWFNTIDPHLLSLTAVDGTGRLDLLVIPPETLGPAACHASAAASSPDNRVSASAVLAQSTASSVAT